MSALRSLIAHLRLLRPRRGMGVGLAMAHGAPPAIATTHTTVSDEGWGLVPRRAASRVRFSKERLARLRRLIGAPNDGLLPPIAVQLLASPLHLELLGDPSFPLRALGLVHVANAIDEHRALPDGLALDLEAFVAGLASTRRGEEMTLVTEARVDGELVYRAVSTALQRARRSGARGEVQLVRVAPEGALVRRELIEVPESTGRRYARVAGDLNPIHQHAWLARPFGFPRAIVHGTWTLSRALELARAELPRWPRTIECTFRKPVMLPSTIALEVRRAAQELRVRVVSPSDAAFEHVLARIHARA